MDFELSLVQRGQMALDYVENHLHENIIIESVAKEAFMSQASFYAIFSRIFDTTIKDYITKRRLTCSAYDLIHTEHSILEIALDATYGSYEAYSRKFKKVFGVSPRLYRNNGLYVEMYPAVNLISDHIKYTDGGKMMTVSKTMNGERVNEKMKHHIKGYLMDIDIDRFMKINENYGREIGDKVILEVPTRIEQVLKKLNIDANIVRISGDEFAIVLKDLPKVEVEVLATEIINSMVPTFDFGKVCIPVTVCLGIAKYDSEGIDTVKKTALEALMDAKNNGRNTYKFY